MLAAAGNGRCSLLCRRLWSPLLTRRRRQGRLGRPADAHPVAMQQAPPAAAAGAGTAALHTSAPAGVRDVDRLQLQVEEKLGIPRDIYDKAGGLRVRQHVNPLKKELQVPTEPPAWQEVYADPCRPMVLDLGCGYGRFLLALSKEMPGHNMLGLEIRDPIISRANKWAASLGLDRSVLFLRANATITLAHTLASCPGPLDLVCVQFPDPHFKNRHRKRRTVQASLVQALSRLMAPGTRVFLQSDVLEAAEHMRDEFEKHGSAWFQPCRELHSGDAAAVFHAASPPKPKQQPAVAQQAQQQQQQEEEQQGEGEQQERPEREVEGQQQQAEAADQQQEQQQGQQEQQEGLQEEGEEAEWQSKWVAAGWLKDNPLGVPTEREILTSEKGQPVYRIMLRRTAAPGAAAAGQEGA